MAERLKELDLNFLNKVGLACKIPIELFTANWRR